MTDAGLTELKENVKTELNNELELVNIQTEHSADITIQFSMLNKDETDGLINNIRANRQETTKSIKKWENDADAKEIKKWKQILLGNW